MEIRDIDFGILESVRKKCITFAKDGNTVVKPYKTLYNVEQITHNAEHHNLYFEVVKGKESWEEDSYCLWDDLGKICIKVDRVPRYWNLKDFTEALHEYKYFGVDGFFKRLKVSGENGCYINKADIEICAILGEIELAKHYMKYREELIRKQEENRQAEIEEREVKEREEVEKHKAEIQKTITKAENTIRTHGTLCNKEFEGKTIVLYLLKKYGVNVPIKTQGWVNNALAKVWFRDGEITYSYYKRSKDSTVFWKYLKELEEKILQSV